MEIKNVNDCLKFRLLRKIEPDKEKSKKSLEIAKKRIESAKKALKLGIFDYVILESYMAMFHASRALLYMNGIQEKSHYAISIYLKERYSDKIPLPVINLWERRRIARHAAMYDLEYRPEKEDAELSIKDADLFVKSIKGILKND